LVSRKFYVFKKHTGQQSTYIDVKLDWVFQGKLVPKLTLGTFLTLSVRNVPNLQSYLVQENISLNTNRGEQNYTLHL